MTNYLVSQEAKGDLVRIWLYIAERSSEHQATGFIKRIEEKFQTLGNNPLIGRYRPEIAEDTRSFPVGSYIIFYGFDIEPIEIFRVLHQRQDISQIFDIEA